MADEQQITTTDRPRPVWAKAFLAMLRKTGNVTKAASAAKIERSTAYDLKKASDSFATEWADALNEASDILEAEAWRRAKTGVKKAVYYKDQVVGFEREYSDTLMALLLKAHKPEKYKDRQDVTSGDKPITINFVKIPPRADDDGSA